MNYLEEVQRKRREMADRQTREADMRRSSMTAKENSERVAGEVARQSARTRVTTQPVEVKNDDLAKGKDIGEVVNEMKELLLAQYLTGSSAKPSIILTDQTDLGDKMTQMGDKLAGIVAEIKNDTQLAEAVKGMMTRLDAMSKAMEAATKTQVAAVTKSMQQLEKTVEGKDFNPKITVKAPEVNVPPMDMTPMMDAMHEMMKPEDEGIDLSDYYAQDEKTEGTYQYVGFVNPDGGWYIISNDMSADGATALRFKFGKRDYSGAWEKASSFNYTLLNEAINAVSA